MATVIDSLVVELGLDPSKFTKGQKEAMDALRSLETESKKRGKAVEDSAKGVEQAFGMVQSRLLALTALFLGGAGVTEFTQRMMKLQTATANVARTFGISSQALQTWAAAGERAGFRGDAVSQGLAAIQQQRYNALNYGEPSGLVKLSRGWKDTSNPLVVTSPNGQMLPAEQQALNIAKWLERAGPQGASALMRDGGLSQDFVGFLSQGRDKVQKLLQESKKFAPSDAEIKQWTELNDAFTHTTQAATALSRELSEKMLPTLTSMLNTLTYWIQYWRGDKDAQKQADQEGQDLHEKLRKKFGNPEDAQKNFNGWINRMLGIGKDKALQDNTEQLKKLNDNLKGGGASVQQQSFIGGFGAGGDNARVVQASFSGGGSGGFTWGGPGGFSGSGGGSRTRGSSYTEDGTMAPVGTGKFDRSDFAKEAADPEMQRRLATIVFGEGGHKPSRQQLIYLESIFNRAKARGQTLEQATRMWPGPGGYYPRSTFMNGRPQSQEELDRFVKNVLGPVLAGSDVSGETFGFPTTGNASGGVASRGVASGKYVRHYTMKNGETFVQERRDNIRRLEDSRIKGSAGIPLPRSRPADLDKLEKSSIEMRTDLRGSGGAGDISIGNMHIYPQRIDGDLASVIRPRVQRHARIASVNNGPT